MNAVERLAAALIPPWQDHDAAMIAGEQLAADPDLAADIELGAAWRRAEAALPEGCVIESLYRLRVYGDTWQKDLGWAVAVIRPDDSTEEPWMNADGPTPTAALIALAEKLEAMK